MSFLYSSRSIRHIHGVTKQFITKTFLQLSQQSLVVSNQNFTNIFSHNSAASINLDYMVLKLSAVHCCCLVSFARSKTCSQNHMLENGTQN